MPADLPGFYYDASKRKYFKIQANHIAPESKYSRQAVAAERKHRNEVTQTQQRHEEVSKGRLRRASYLRHPVLGLPFQRSLGDLKLSSSSIIKRQWASSLQDRFVFDSLKSDVFAIEQQSKLLFGISTPRGGTTREFCVTKPSLRLVHHDQPDMLRTPQDDVLLYETKDRIPLFDTNEQLICVEPISRDIVIWVTRNLEAVNHGAGGMSKVNISRRRDWGWPGEVYGEWGTSSLYGEDDSIVWDVKASPHRTKVALAETGHLVVCDLQGDLTCRQVTEDWEQKEWMCLDWKSEHVIVSGSRNGEIWLTDVRMGGGAVQRGKCPWAISKVKAIGKEGVLVWGLEGAQVLDLRFAKSRKSKKKKSVILSQPAVNFDVTDGWMQKRYGMGWDYDDQLGIAASACTDLHKRNSIGLWDVRTGRRIVDSQMSTKPFSSPITCIQMANIENGANVSTLLAACEGKIHGWAV